VYPNDFVRLFEVSVGYVVAACQIDAENAARAAALAEAGLAEEAARVRAAGPDFDVIQRTFTDVFLPRLVAAATAQAPSLAQTWGEARLSALLCALVIGTAFVRTGRTGPASELAEVLAEEHEGWAEEDLEPQEGEEEPVVKPAAWERVCGEKGQELARLVEQGVLSGRRKGRRLLVQAGSFYDRLREPVPVLPDWGFEFEVLPDKQADEVRHLQKARRHTQEECRRAPLSLVLDLPRRKARRPRKASPKGGGDRRGRGHTPPRRHLTAVARTAIYRTRPGGDRGRVRRGDPHPAVGTGGARGRQEEA
jgi:hypothetical protein